MPNETKLFVMPLFSNSFTNFTAASSSNMIKQRGRQGKQNPLLRGVANLTWSYNYFMGCIAAFHESTENYIMQQYVSLLSKVSMKPWENAFFNDTKY